jgi:hypothetical protein
MTGIFLFRKKVADEITDSATKGWVDEIIKGVDKSKVTERIGQYLKVKSGVAGKVIEHAVGEVLDLGGIVNEAAEEAGKSIYKLDKLHLEIRRSKCAKNAPCKKLEVRVIADHHFNVPFLVDDPKMSSTTYQGVIEKDAGSVFNQVAQSCKLDSK